MRARKLKTCSKCGEAKSLDNYKRSDYARKDGSYGFRPECRPCYNRAEMDRRLKDPARAMHIAAKNRAKKAGLPFNLEVSDIVIPATCPVLGIELHMSTAKGQGDTWDSPSLDKIIPELGYVKGNVQVISKKANTMKLNATPEELWKFAQWVLNSQQ